MAGQLTIREREQLAQFRGQGLSKAEIGRRLGRHRATIGRELTRNGDGVSYWAYRAHERRFALLPPGLRHTVTFDNGKEFAEHERIARTTGIDVYFARPYHAWERGANETFNRLLRLFFPKRTDFRGTSPLEVKDVLDLLNDRPRKRLGYRTPREVLGQHYPVALRM